MTLPTPVPLQAGHLSSDLDSLPLITASYRDVRSTNSSSDHTLSATFATIAGVTRSVLCSRTSKKFENLQAAVALHFAHYNLSRRTPKIVVPCSGSLVPYLHRAFAVRLNPFPRTLRSLAIRAFLAARCA